MINEIIPSTISEERVAVTDTKRGYPLGSRYRWHRVFTTDWNEEEVEFYELWEVPEVSKSPSDQFHTVGSGEEFRLDLISQRYYGTVLYKWVIAVANGIKDIFQEVTPGRVLRIPGLQTVLSLVR